MLKKRIRPYLLILILTALAVSPAFALGEGNRNLLLIGVMGLSPIIILYFGRFDRINPWLAFFMVSIIIFPLIYQPQSMRWSTVLYAIMFCLTFIAYKELLYHSKFTVIHYYKLLKYLIYAYFIVLLIQQFCVLTGLPIFNLSNYNPITPWKLNSLSAEPSHTARVVALLLYSYITIKELLLDRSYNFRLDFKKDKWVWIAFFWTMVTMGSGTAFLFIGVVLLKLIRFKNFIPFLIIGCVMFVIVDFVGSNSINRTYNVVLATASLDESIIIEADHSASFRIVPMIVLAKMLDVTTLNGWFGYGIDYVSTFMSNFIKGGGDKVSGGGLFALAIEYGLVSFFLFIIFSIKACYDKNDRLLSVIFWFLLVFMMGVNIQITWLCIILLISNKMFKQLLKKKPLKKKIP
ncbi:hypothetical protein ABXT64_06555 [Candidatus Marifrigoribacter sp. Uisw_064]|jgi:hypothetical protein|uniref:hypothetical protein n=1 Tax=Candidatus Marifrigoribacter sp. Uisw_064 TaxID=3230970 RepID=UPI003D4C6D20